MNSSLTPRDDRPVTPVRKPRLSALERLARRICWLGFQNSDAVGFTEATYWDGIDAAARARYMEEAKWFVWCRHALVQRASSLAILNLAMRERAKGEPT